MVSSRTSSVPVPGPLSSYVVGSPVYFVHFTVWPEQEPLCSWTTPSPSSVDTSTYTLPVSSPWCRPLLRWALEGHIIATWLAMEVHCPVQPCLSFPLWRSNPDDKREETKRECWESHCTELWPCKYLQSPVYPASPAPPHLHLVPVGQGPGAWSCSP